MRERMVHLLVSAKTKRLRGLILAVTPALPDEEFLKKQIVERLRLCAALAKDPLIPDSPLKQALNILPKLFLDQLMMEARRRV